MDQMCSLIWHNSILQSNNSNKLAIMILFLNYHWLPLVTVIWISDIGYQSN